jgi:hypothetical protein
MITSGGKRKPAKPDLGAGTRAGEVLTVVLGDDVAVAVRH